MDDTEKRLASIYDDFTAVTPPPWGDDTAPKVDKGDSRVSINGGPPGAQIRLLSERNYQLALRCVNEIYLQIKEETQCRLVK